MSFKKDCHKTEFTIFHVNRYILFTVKFQKKGFSFLYYAEKFTRTEEHFFKLWTSRCSSENR